MAGNVISHGPAKREVPGHDEVRVEAGEGVPGRTDGHVGKLEVSDGESLDGGGDWTARPVSEGLVDQDSGSTEAGDDDTEPEKSDGAPGGGEVHQAVNGGGLKELFESLHSPALLVTEKMLGPKFSVLYLVVEVTPKLTLSPCIHVKCKYRASNEQSNKKGVEIFISVSTMSIEY